MLSGLAFWPYRFSPQFGLTEQLAGLAALAHLVVNAPNGSGCWLPVSWPCAPLMPCTQMVRFGFTELMAV